MQATGIASAPWTALAELEWASGRPCETAAALEKALAHNPTDVTALTLGYEALRLLGRSSAARRRDELALELDSANPPALERRFAANVRRAGGRLAPEDPTWRAIERLARTRSSALSLLSFVRVCGGDLAGAGDMAVFVARRPRLPQARIERARLLDALDRPLTALQEVDAARALLPWSRELDLLACRVAVRAGLPARAQQESENLLARYGNTWDVASTAAWALAHLGQSDRAAELSRTAVERQPFLPAAWLEHGRVLTRCEQPREAVAATERGWSLLPLDDGLDLDAPAALDLARLHGRLGHCERARHWATQALESCAALAEHDPVQAHVLRGWALSELGPAAGPVAAGLLDLTPTFLRLEERRLTRTQIAETAVG